MSARTPLSGRFKTFMPLHLIGEALLLLPDDFEVLTWQGQTTASTHHWLRGFLAGSLPSLAGRGVRVSEPEC